MLNKVPQMWCIQISVGFQLHIHGTHLRLGQFLIGAKVTAFLFNNFDYVIVAPCRWTLLEVCHHHKCVVPSALSVSIVPTKNKRQIAFHGYEMYVHLHCIKSIKKKVFVAPACSPTCILHYDFLYSCHLNNVSYSCKHSQQFTMHGVFSF